MPRPRRHHFGSRRLRDFDAALVPYAGASVFSAFGLGYRYAMWLTKPPTRLYWRRGWRLFFAPSRVLQNGSRLAALFAVNDWQFGGQPVRTKVFVLVPTEVTHVDVAMILIGALRRPSQPPADPGDVAWLLECGVG